MLILSNSFNQPVQNLPASLKGLFLGSDFDNPVDSLPSGLLYLRTGVITNILIQGKQKMATNKFLSGHDNSAIRKILFTKNY